MTIFTSASGSSRRSLYFCLAAMVCLWLPLPGRAQTYTITTIAGNGVQGYAGDGGLAVQAEIWALSGVAVDGFGNVFIADTGNCRIRKVAGGIITTVAGNTTCGFAGDGAAAIQAELNFPRGVAVDAAGNIYIADGGNYRIRKVLANGTITTIAGDGNAGFSGDGGPAIQAEMQAPWNVAADPAGNVFIVDRGNQRIRKIGTDGNIHTVAGTGIAAHSGDGGQATAAAIYTPVGATVDSAGNLYIAEAQGASIRKVNSAGIIQTIVGTGAIGYAGDGGPAVNAQLNDPQSVAVDPAGNLFIGDEDNERIREVTPDGVIHTVTGNGVKAFLGDGGPAVNGAVDLPEGVASDPAGVIYFVDSGNKRVRQLSAPPAATRYPLTLMASPAAGGTVSPASGVSYNAGTVVSVAAVANPGYAFTGWTGNVATPASAWTTVTMNASQTVTASFAAGQPPSAVTIFSPGQGAAGVSPSTSLTWTTSAGASAYDVYFGTSPSPTLAQANLTTTSYSPAMSPGVTYYWSVTARNAFGATPSAVWVFTTAASTGLRFVPVTPCRILDTRAAAGPFGGPSIAGGSTRTVSIPQSTCNIPAAALAYAVNVTVVPPGPLGYLSIWPAGVSQPVVSTLNALDGRIDANAAIVPAGANGAINLYVSDTTHVILDINGYFVPAATLGSLSFYSAAPCRIMDTRGANGPFGGPFLGAGSTRTFTMPAACAIPSSASAYSLNITAIPHASLGYLTAWPAGQAQPNVSTLNSQNGQIVANAAIVPAGTNGGISVYVTDDTDLVIDLNGYFAPPGGTGGLSLYTLTPCRVTDTRNAAGPFGGPAMAGSEIRNFTIPASACSVPATAQAYSLNITVVPPGPLTFLTAWPQGQPFPTVSTLNSYNGAVVANAAIVVAGPAGTSGGVSIFVQNPTHLILDINAYLAP